eukprot:NODE_456_length_8237_cov_0.078398.p1 type:complete len:1249 gc:universal NODE_456_length_8237_cov_0.078398:3034-6780(+)
MLNSKEQLDRKLTQLERQKEDLIKKSKSKKKGKDKMANSPPSKRPTTKLRSVETEVKSKGVDPFFKLSLDDMLLEVEKNPTSLGECNVVMIQSIEPIPTHLMKGINLSQDSWMDALKIFSKLEETDENKKLLCKICTVLLGAQAENLDAINGHAVLLCFLKCMAESDPKQSIGHGLLYLLCSKSLKLPIKWKHVIQEKIENHLISFSKSDEPEALDKVIFAKWEMEKEIKGVYNEGMDNLFELSGLGSIKEQFFHIYQLFTSFKERGMDIQGKRLNILLMGNPGTGKTTVAKFYAQFLADLGILSGTAFVDITGAKLVQNGVKELQKHLDSIEEQNGGMLFIDEAYQLDPSKESNGRHCVDLLLTEIESKTGRLVVAFAGYEKNIQELMTYNDGLHSRFPYQFVLEDYSDEMLHDILISLIRKLNFTVEDGFYGIPIKAFVKRIASMRGKKGFGNARQVQNSLDKVMERQAMRLKEENNENKFELLLSDLLGPNPIDVIKSCKPWLDLKKMIGLSKVKESVEALLTLSKRNYELEIQLKPINYPILNKIFIGNPGTGKTTVAKLYGHILKELGFLSDGEVVIKNPSDFVGSVLGESEKNTLQILKSTVGKVLIIDEAYGLYSTANIYGKAVIDTIVAEVQNTPGDDRCVLLLGYSDKMRELLDKSNEGLSRRFDANQPFEFTDYSKDELMKIFNLKMSRLEQTCSQESLFAAIDVLEREKMKQNFGNGGSVDNIIRNAISRMNGRKGSELLPEDFDPNYNTPPINVDDLFADMLDCSDLKSRMKAWQNKLEKTGLMGTDPELPMCIKFLGPPGTGKTTSARIMGKYYRSLGILADDTVVEASASDLIGQFVGQTSLKTKAKFEEALGKVLFIDEAYRLSPGNNTGGYAKEALDEIVDLITKPKFHRKIIIILAGYERDIKHLMNANPGLASRFSESVSFHNFSSAQCLDLLCGLLAAKNFKLSRDEELLTLFDKLISKPNWGNGRDIGAIKEQLISEGLKLITAESINSNSTFTLPLDLVRRCLTELIELRETSSAVDEKPVLPMENLSLQLREAQDTHPKVKVDHSNKAIDPHEVLDNETKDQRDAGVTDAVWQQLQLDINEREKEDKYCEKLINQANEEKNRLQKTKEELERLKLLILEQSILIEDNKESDEDEKRRKRQKIEEQRQLQEQERLMKLLVDENERREQAAALKARRAEERREIEVRAQEKIRELGVCPANFVWIKQSGGYRCAGGSHFIHNAQLGVQ